MKFVRVELHNHTDASDGNNSIDEVVKYAIQNNYENLFITDHNTFFMPNENYTNDLQQLNIYIGVEITSFWGHIFSYGLNNLPVIPKINPNLGDDFFDELKKQGSLLTGILHPFIVDRPIMSGCRFKVNLSDWNYVDYIEIFNTSLGLTKEANDFMGNREALKLWENKFLEGFNISGLSGKDLHELPVKDWMTTYLVLNDENEVNINSIIHAIQNQQSFVSRGPLISWELNANILNLKIDNSNTYNEWNKNFLHKKCKLVIKNELETMVKDLILTNELMELEFKVSGARMTINLYEDDTKLENILLSGVGIKKEED